MTHTESLREQIQNNLIANACALHHVTGGSVAVIEIPVPGTERVIVIGVRADVARHVQQHAALQALVDQAQELDMGYGPAGATDSEGGRHD